MSDTIKGEGGGAHEDLGGSEKVSRRPNPPSGETDQGTQGSAQLSDGQDSVEQLEDTCGVYQGIFKALASESSAEVRKDLVDTLAKVAELGSRRQELSITKSAEYDLAELRADEEIAKAGRKELLHTSRRVTAMWAAPALFAFVLGTMLFFFLKWQMKDAALIIRELLVLLMMGALGWAAGRKSGGGEKPGGNGG